jgi:hypothetical protein
LENATANSKAPASLAAALTFGKAARQVHEELKPGWKNAKHAAQWISTLEAYVFPRLGSKPLDQRRPLMEAWARHVCTG